MTQTDLVVSADFGTSSIKVGVVDASLNIIARATEAYDINLASGGIAEQQPEDWWTAFAKACRTLADEVENLQQRVGAIVMCCQVCGTICADENGAPLRPCLTWLDKRAANCSRELISGFPSIEGYQVGKLARWLYLSNGAPFKNGGDMPARIRWIAQNEPDIDRRTRWHLDVRDWLVMRATGEATTIAESANLSWAMDTRRGKEGWSPALARLSGVDLDRMPRIISASEIAGQLTKRAAADLGLAPDTPVLGGTSDFTASTLGSGETEDGALHVSAATSSWIAGFMPGRRLNIAASYATVASGLNYRPIIIATQENVGSALSWAVRNSGDAADVEDLNAAFADLGATAPDDPFFVPWLAGEKSPRDDERLRAAYWGMGLQHDTHAMRRAAMEGVAFNLRWAYDKIVREKDARTEGPLTIVGGVAANPLFARTVANVLNREVRIGETRHVGVLGTATLAAPLMGWATTPEDAAARFRQQPAEHVAPDPAGVELHGQRYERLSRMRPHIIKAYRH